MTYIILLKFDLLTTISLRSQSIDLPAITVDRPYFTTNPLLVTSKHFQIESGSAYERASGNYTLREMLLFNTFLARYSFNKVLEARLQADFAQLKTESGIKTGLNLIKAGLKFGVYKGKGAIPAIALMVNITMPFTQEKVFKKNGQVPLPSFYALWQNPVTEKFGISYNFGVEFIDTYTDTSDVGLVDVVSERFAPPVEFASICLEYDITSRLTPFIESYNWFGHGMLPKNFMDIGLAYLIGNNVRLDLSASMSLNDPSHYIMINGGFAWRISKKSDKK